MATTDLQIQSAVAQILLGLQRPDDSFIVRRTTLAADAVSGAAGITLTDVTGFQKNSLVAFADDLGEEYLSVGNGYAGANPVPLDFTHMGYTGLQHTHPAGTVVYTNLGDFTIVVENNMLAIGDPVLFVRVTRTPYKARTMPNGNSGTFYTSIYYERMLTPPGEEGGVRMPRNSWVARQEKATRADLAIIKDALLTKDNQQLRGEETTALATQMAPLGGGDLLICEYDTVWVKQTQTWHFGATISAIYAGNFQ